MASAQHSLSAFFRAHRRVLVLTGAGISRDSGIPTYRDAAGRWQHSAPIMHRDFIDQHTVRQRYWARSSRGWPLIRDARPNPAHRALAQLEQLDHVSAVITQNVDRLHQRAGSRRVIDLHGRLDRVRCLECNALTKRDTLQAAVATPEHNNAAGVQRPDGDMDVPDHLVAATTVPNCTTCGGTLMPDVVFFGGSIRRDITDACESALAAADALLAVGSSLQVFSGYRICRQAVRAGKPLAILNKGTTRADDIAELKVDGRCGDTLKALLQDLECAPGEPFSATGGRT